MIFGGIEKERIQLNEDTLWSGYPQDKTNYRALEHLEQARKLIFDHEYSKAQDIIHDNMLGPWNESYQPLGNLYLEFDGLDNICDYKRELDLKTAVAKTFYRSKDASFFHLL